MKRVAIYARVSTVDKGQDVDTQLLQLREYATNRQFEIAFQYVDYASGTDKDRPQYKSLLNDAKKRKFDIVLVWKYDRFARSVQQLVNALNEFKALGIDFISYIENVDTTSATGELIFNIMASLAQFESSLISVRVKAGMERAKKQGKSVCRPTLSTDKINKIKELVGSQSLWAISKALNIPYSTVHKYAK
jgi:DNA invertase Pin-like site-specific DNA recombinase